MKKLKVLTVVGTRPEIIRLSRVIPELDIQCEHILVHTGQNYDYELNEIFFEDLNIRKANYFLSSAGPTSVETIANVIIKVDHVLEKERPDAVLVLGDTNSCMSIIAAKRRKIPTFHMEAGNRCFDMRVPEEINRRIVDHTADVNLTYSAIAREYLLREGLNPELVIKTGSPMKEVLDFHEQTINRCNILKKLQLKNNEYFVVSVHREENIDNAEKFTKFIDLLNKLGSKYEVPIIVSTHPRTRNKVESSGFDISDKVNFIKPLNFTDYNKLQICSMACLSDSGTINEESSILNFPALNLRESHERPEGMEEASVMLVGFNSDRVLQAIDILKGQSRGCKRDLAMVADYSSSNVSKKVVRIIHSYTDYVNRIVWKKY